MCDCGCESVSLGMSGCALVCGSGPGCVQVSVEVFRCMRVCMGVFLCMCAGCVRVYGEKRFEVRKFFVGTNRTQSLSEQSADSSEEPT